MAAILTMITTATRVKDAVTRNVDKDRETDKLYKSDADRWCWRRNETIRSTDTADDTGEHINVRAVPAAKQRVAR